MEYLEDAIVPSEESQRHERRQVRFNNLAHSILNGRVDMATLQDKFDRAALAAWYMQFSRCGKCDRLTVEGHICLFCRGDLA